MIEVLASGALATVQDLGRPGYAHLGVPTSGAADRDALALANRLVGNPEDRAGIEMTLIGATLAFRRRALIALAGASASVRADDRAIALWAPTYVKAGSVLTIGPIEGGARLYLAVRGGVDVTPVLGSRSTDLLTGLGPSPLHAGCQLPVGSPEAARWPTVDIAPMDGRRQPPLVEVITDPRSERFAASALEVLGSVPYRVTATSNRIAVRLEGPRLPRQSMSEVPSEGLTPGAIQIPPSEQPIVFLSDHPTTGGYPVIGVVRTKHLSRVAQLRPGDELRFRLATK